MLRNNWKQTRRWFTFKKTFVYTHNWTGPSQDFLLTLAMNQLLVKRITYYQLTKMALQNKDLSAYQPIPLFISCRLANSSDQPLETGSSQVLLGQSFLVRSLFANQGRKTNGVLGVIWQSDSPFKTFFSFTLLRKARYWYYSLNHWSGWTVWLISWVCKLTTVYGCMDS